ncbi:hypothetical protein N0V87_003654, partial [Didymella glomerata]
DEEGELVGFAGVNDDGVVEWDDEDKEFGTGEGDAGEQSQGGEADEGQQGEVEYELYETPLVATIDGPVSEIPSSTADAVSDAQPHAQQDDRQVAESATLAQKGSWPGSMDGLW